MAKKVGSSYSREATLAAEKRAAEARDRQKNDAASRVARKAKERASDRRTGVTASSCWRVDPETGKITGVIDKPTLKAEKKKRRKKARTRLTTGGVLLLANGKSIPTRPQSVSPAPSPQNSSSFYSSEEWLELRYRALKLHGAACQCCGATRRDGVKLHVDHIKPRSKYPELALELSNLQVLCEPCNLGKRAWDETDWR